MFEVRIVAVDALIEFSYRGRDPNSKHLVAKQFLLRS